MRRVVEGVRNIHPKLLTKMIHQITAKMNEIHGLKGKRFLQLSSLQKVLSLVNAKSAPLRYSVSLLHVQPFDQIVFPRQLFVNTNIPVAQR